MQGPRLLIVEDDELFATQVKRALEPLGYELELALTGAAAQVRATTWRPDLILLDLGLPDIHGLAVLQEAQQLRPATRVCIMTSAGELTTKLAAFALGSDDYLVKPFALDELQARVAALLRRGKRLDVGLLTFGRLAVARGAPCVWVSTTLIALSPMEHRLLLYLALHAGEVLSRSELLDEVWRSADRYPNTVDVHVELLRKKLRPHLSGDCIVTAYRQGYYFDPAACS
jgi:two-component system response regulator PhoP